MPAIDESDLEILRLLSEDARRPYSEIAKKVGLSAPTVSERIDRLQDAGVIRRMTVDIDRNHLDTWTPVLAQLEPMHRDPSSIADELSELPITQSVTRTVEGTLFVRMRGPRQQVRQSLSDEVGLEPEIIKDISIISETENTHSVPESVIEDEPKLPANPR